MKKGGLTMAMPSAQAAPPCVAPPLRAVTVVNVSIKALLLIAPPPTTTCPTSPTRR